MRYVICSLLLFGVGFVLVGPAQSSCTNATAMPQCVEVDDSGDMYQDHNVTNGCSYPVTLWFDVTEGGDAWRLDNTNFTARYGFMALEPNEAERSGIRYDTQLTVRCCPDLEGTHCTDPASSATPW